MTSHSCLSSAPCTILLILQVSLSGCCPCLYGYRPTSPLHLSKVFKGVYCLLTHTHTHTLFCIPFSVWPFPGSHRPNSTIPCISLLSSGLPLPSLSMDGTGGVESRGKQAGRTASTKLSKESVGKPSAPLSACPLPAHHRPGPFFSPTHKNCQ